MDFLLLTVPLLHRHEKIIFFVTPERSVQDLIMRTCILSVTVSRHCRNLRRAEISLAKFGQSSKISITIFYIERYVQSGIAPLNSLFHKGSSAIARKNLRQKQRP